jgi:hypothetical protein
MLFPKSKTKKPLSLPLSYLGRMYLIFLFTLFYFILKNEHNEFLTTIRICETHMEEKFNLCKNTCKALKNNEIYLGIEKCNK